MIFFKLIMERLSSDSFEFINYISIKYWPWNVLLQKTFQANEYLRINSECLLLNLENAIY